MSRYNDQIRVRPRDRTKPISCWERSCSLLRIFEIGSQFHSSYAMGSGEVIPADINYIVRDEKLNFHFHIFILPCIVTDFFSNNQPDALIIQIYSVIKLYMFRAESGWNCVPSWLCLEAVIETCMILTSAECIVENSWWWAKKMPEICRVL
jgi:hypothetical protein